MKKSLCTFFTFMLIGIAAFAQPLSGIKYIPGDYPTVKEAIADLNLKGVISPGVTFNVAANLKEHFSTPVTGHITTLTGSVNSPITFQKYGAGADPLITAAPGVGSMDAIFMVAGCDYVTFDGFNINENTGNFEETGWMEWGFAILKAQGTDGSQNITIKNCTISLDIYNPASIGIYSNNHTATSVSQLNVTDASGANSNLKIFGNTINNSYFGIYVKGFADASPPYAFYDQNNEIGKDGANYITNVGGGDFVAYGIYTIYQNNLKVANNHVTSATYGTKTIYGIYLTTAHNANYDLYGNTVSIQFTPDDPNGNTSFNPVYCDMGANGTTNVANIYNNTVTNCTFPSAQNQAATRCMYLLNMGVTANVYGNVISNNTIGSNGTTTATGEIRYLWCQKTSSITGPLVVHDNSVTGNARIQPYAGPGNTEFLSIVGSGTTLDAYNNLVTNNIVSSLGGAHGLNIIFNGNISQDIHNNTVSNITEANGAFSGIYYGMALLGRIYNNKVENLRAADYAQNASINGIYHSTGSTAPAGATTYYYNNLISELSCPGAEASLGYSWNVLNGFYVEASANVKGFYNNTVFLNAATNASIFGSSAFCAADLAGVDLRNNIFVNMSASAGANGYTVAIRSRSTNLSGFTSNYNNVYAGVPGASNLVFHNGTAGDQTLEQYQSRVQPQESQSVSTLPPFSNVAVAPYNLHIKTNVPTACESGGTIVTLPAITTDFDGNPRYPNAGYPVNPSFTPTAPDLGAYEFGGLPKDLTPPSIVYTPLTDINHGNQRTLTATITDASGVPISSFGLPVLYWRKNGQGYIPAQGIFTGSDSYLFTFGGGSVLNDVIDYYIVAQDNTAPFPNTGAFPSQGATGFSANPPACTTPPSNPSSYKIILDISGVKHIGVGKDYITLTAAAADLNLKYMAGPVTFVLDDNSYPNESYPVKFNDRPGNSDVNTLTIVPNTGASPVLTNAIAGQGIIVMNGIDYATIDGSNNGTSSKDLTIENSSGGGNSYVLGISNHGGTDPSKFITIKNSILRGQKSYNMGFEVPTYVLVINAGGGLYGGGYDNCLITNNAIVKAKYGIDISGSSDNMNRNITITNNIIGSADTTYYIQRYGIAVTNSDNTLISGNEIMGPAVGNGFPQMFGIIYYGLCSNTKIHRNKIHDWYSYSLGSYGIKCSNNNDGSTTEIFNNQIYNITTPGENPGPSNNNAYGIFIRQGSNIKIWHNSIYLHGASLMGYDPSSACICTYTSASANLDIRDNILRNSMTYPNPAPFFTGRAYAIQHSGTAASFSALDYNDYFVDGYNATIAQTWVTGIGPTGEYVTLADWQAYTGKDAHSLDLNPAFVSDIDPIDLHVTNVNLNSVGGQKILNTDYDGATRFAPPDMGAFEWSKVITDYHTLAATNVTETGATLNGDINTNGEVVAVNFDYGTTTSYGSVAIPNPSTVRSVGTLLPVNAAITGLLPNTTYHYRFWGIPTTSGQANIYGADMTFTTPGIPTNTNVINSYSNDTCFNAMQTITVGGTPNTFVVTPTGHVTMIAGQKITYLPGSQVQLGGYLLGKITLDNQFCGYIAPSLVTVKSGKEEAPVIATTQSLIKVYPNPTSGVFTLEINGESEAGNANVEIFSMMGGKVFSTEIAGAGKQELSLSGKPVGIYLIRVSTGSNVEIIRIIKQ